MTSASIGELAHALDGARKDGTANSATPTAGLTSTSTIMVTSDTPVELTGVRDDPESALAALIGILEDLGFITDSTTATTP